MASNFQSCSPTALKSTILAGVNQGKPTIYAHFFLFLVNIA